MYGIPNASNRKLQRVQNGAVRLVLGAKGYHVNIDYLRRTKLHWLPMKDLIVFKILLLTYKSLNDWHMSTFRTFYPDTNPITPLAQPLNVFSNLHLKYPLVITGNALSLPQHQSYGTLYLFPPRTLLQWLFSRNCCRLTYLTTHLFQLPLPTYHLWEQDAEDLAESDVLVTSPFQGFRLCRSLNLIFVLPFYSLQSEYVVLLFICLFLFCFVLFSSCFFIHLWEQDAEDLAESDVLVASPLQGSRLCRSHNLIILFFNVLQSAV